MPGMVDAVSAASIRLERVAAALAELVYAGDATGHLQAVDEDLARDVVRRAIRSLEQTIESLVTALAEDPSEEPQPSS